MFYFGFSDGKAEGTGKMKEILGVKWAGLVPTIYLHDYLINFSNREDIIDRDLMKIFPPSQIEESVSVVLIKKWGKNLEELESILREWAEDSEGYIQWIVISTFLHLGRDYYEWTEETLEKWVVDENINLQPIALRTFLEMGTKEGSYFSERIDKLVKEYPIKDKKNIVFTIIQMWCKYPYEMSKMLLNWTKSNDHNLGKVVIKILDNIPSVFESMNLDKDKFEIYKKCLMILYSPSNKSISTKVRMVIRKLNGAYSKSQVQVKKHEIKNQRKKTTKRVTLSRHGKGYGVRIP